MKLVTLLVMMLLLKCFNCCCFVVGVVLVFIFIYEMTNLQITSSSTFYLRLFLYESVLRSFFLVTVQLCNFLVQ